MKKNILVTGSEGMIGRELVKILKQDKNNKILEADLKLGDDLRNFSTCRQLCKDIHICYHLAGIKGSPIKCKTRPADFFTPLLQFNTNMLEAARLCGVKKYLYTSSVGVYHPTELLKEDDVWDTMPSKNDWFPGWAKRAGELQVDAYKIQYGWKDIAIVRPANVYGMHDNFEGEDAMVIPALIKRAINSKDELMVWGDGSPIRDFIHARDVARGMVMAIDKMPDKPVNLGSGTGVSIKELVNVIVKNVNPELKIKWDTSKPSGDKKRLMDISRAKALGWEPQISLEQGIKETIKWYKEYCNVK